METIICQAPKNLDSLLQRLARDFRTIPEPIKAKALRVLEFCHAEIPDDGTERLFPLGQAHFKSGWRNVLTVSYSLQYSAQWVNCYHNDSEREEIARIVSDPILDTGIHPYSESFEKA